jgi:hypothetical protein
MKVLNKGGWLGVFNLQQAVVITLHLKQDLDRTVKSIAEDRPNQRD